jgi:hypothetical protein
MDGGTVVDTQALAAAGQTSTQRSRDVLDAMGTSGAPLGRLVGELSGARSAAQAVAARRSVEGVLADVGGALDRLGRLLSAAAGQYAQAEQWAAQAMPSAPVPVPVPTSASAASASGSPSGPPASTVRRRPR